jgi:mannan endo-1,4-beta-mannosidase
MRFISPTWWRTVAGPGKLLGPIICLSLVTIATAVYLSPAGSAVRAIPPTGPSSAPAAASSSDRATSSSAATPDVSSSADGSSSSASKSAPPKSSPSRSRSKAPSAPRTITRYGQPSTRDVTVHDTTTNVDIVHSTTVQTVAASLPKYSCNSFTYQQDAQAVYVANLSDPFGLDGDPGPFNGDGRACTQLPADPNRAPSIPIDAYVAKAPPSKAALVAPAKDYYGLAEDGLPGDTPLLTTLDTAAGKAPSALEWFDYWSSPYNAAKVNAAWATGALPVITWMSESDLSSDPNASTYTLKNITNGMFDDYIRRYASDIRALGKPVAIRLDQEMNGNWFPWSAGFAANQAPSGQPNYYVQAWRHIWNLFQSLGANDDVIWIWAPSRVDTIQPHVTTSGLKYETSLTEDYPGDGYVDWVGMSAYQYKPTDGWTYQATFGQTVAGLHSLTSKLIFIAETGATEAVGSTDYAPQKAQWIGQSLAGFLADNSIVGFCYFNNTVTNVHKVDGVPIQTDWQFTTSPLALSAFQTGIADDRYSSGVMPDGTGA